MISLPLSWLLTVIGVLGATIASMAGIMWSFLKSRLEAQDKLIESQTATISKLQDDVDRMSKGCGIDLCSWRFR